MKKFIVAIICAVAFAMPSFAQGLNDKADNIIGEYQTDRGGSKSKVRISKNADGSYRDIAHPINAQFRAELENAVIDAYNVQLVAAQENEKELQGDVAFV